MAMITTEAASTPALPARISIRTLAEHLGVHPQTVSRWVAEGELPEPRQVGYRKFWIPSDLDFLFAPRKPVGQRKQPTVA